MSWGGSAKPVRVSFSVARMKIKIEININKLVYFWYYDNFYYCDLKNYNE
jgi:hypothetical protein